jgi:membrane protease subunit HflC
MNRARLAILGGLVIFVAIALNSAFFTVRENEQVLVLQFGDLRDTVREPGLQFKIPFVQDIVVLEKRALHVEPPEEEFTLSDAKRLEISTIVLWRIVDPEEFYRTLGTVEAARSRIGQRTNAALRIALRDVPQADVLSPQRVYVLEAVRRQVTQELVTNGIEIADVRIVKAELPMAVTESVMENMRTEREQEAAEIRARGQRDAEVTRAVADRQVAEAVAGARREAESIRGGADNYALNVLSTAYGRDREFFSFYYRLNQYVDALAGSSTQMVLTSDSEFLSLLQGLDVLTFSEPTPEAIEELRLIVEEAARLNENTGGLGISPALEDMIEDSDMLDALQAPVPGQQGNGNGAAGPEGDGPAAEDAPDDGVPAPDPEDDDAEAGQPAADGDADGDQAGEDDGG